MSEKIKRTPKIGEAKFLLRIEGELKKLAEAKAIQTDRSLNGFIVNAIKCKFGCGFKR